MITMSSILGRNYFATDVLFHYKNQKFLYQDFLDLRNASKNNLNKLHKKNVAIIGESRIHSVILPLMLDGTVKSILFLPKDIDENLHSKYLSESSVDYRVWLDEKGLCCEKIIVADGRSQLPNSDHEYTKWIIPTSGTTQNPRLVEHSLKSLTRTTKTDTEVGSRLVWGLVYDINRFAGLQVYLQAMFGGSALAVVEFEDSMVDILDLLKKVGCNALSATPSFWRKFSMCPDMVELPLRIISLGGEIVDDNILNYLRESFPSAKIVHIYASTEAGVGFSVGDVKAGFPLRYIEEGKLGLEIDNNVLMINLPNGARIDTGDIVDVQGDRVFFLGRASGCINVGGNKVIPEEIERVVLELDFIQAVRAYPKVSGFLGSLVAVDVVVMPGFVLDDITIKNNIIKHCRERLESFKIPAKVGIVDDIAITTSGKIKRLI